MLKNNSTELEHLPKSSSLTEKPNGVRLVSILRATPTELMASIAEKFGDPVEWQREQRKDRTLLIVEESNL